MSAGQPGSTADDYVLQRGPEEYRRLRAQARFWDEATQRLLSAAGVARGARCLDVGCGPGEGMRLLAERVGPAGRVVGIDSDGDAAAEALRSLADAPAPAEAHTADAGEATPPGAPFDVVYLRLFLVHQPDPAAMLRRAFEWVCPGGVLVAQEYDFIALDCFPRMRTWDEFDGVVKGTLEIAGGGPRFGMRLPRLLGEAGLGEPDGVDVAGRLVPMDESDGMCELTYTAMLPAALRHGLTSPERRDAFLAELATAGAEHDRLLSFPNLIGAYKHKPA